MSPLGSAQPWELESVAWLYYTFKVQPWALGKTHPLVFTRPLSGLVLGLRILSPPEPDPSGNPADCPTPLPPHAQCPFILTHRGRHPLSGFHGAPCSSVTALTFFLHLQASRDSFCRGTSLLYFSWCGNDLHPPLSFALDQQLPEGSVNSFLSPGSGM